MVKPNVTEHIPRIALAVFLVLGTFSGACGTHGASTELFFGNVVRPQTLLECANSLGTRLTTFWNTWFGAKLLCCLLRIEVPRGSTKMSEVVRSRVVSQRVEAVFSVLVFVVGCV